MSTETSLEPVPETPPRRRWTPRRLRFAGLATGVLLVAAVAGALLWSHSPGSGRDATASRVPTAWTRPAVSEAGLAQRIGVKITQVAVTGGGGLVDLRFQVVDPATAHALHDPSTPPAIVDEQSGLVVNELYMGHSHSGPFRAGGTYYYVFTDPVNWVHRGSEVTVLLGNAQVEHLVVR
jgi:hypothetical protein